MGLFVALIAKVRAMSKGTWRQQMMDLFLRRERRPKPKPLSELEKKLSKDRANLKGLGEEE
jgi:hypothetical protein